MNSIKQDVRLRKLNQKIKQQENNLYQIEKKIQEEKASLGSIVANNRESASTIAKGCKAVSGVLFGLGLPYAFTGNIISAMVAFGSSLIAYGFYAYATKLDKHDIIWRRRCRNMIEELKDDAKAVKVKLFELYEEAGKLKEFGEVTKDAMLEEEIKKDLLKPSYKMLQKKLETETTKEVGMEK